MCAVPGQREEKCRPKPKKQALDTRLCRYVVYGLVAEVGSHRRRAAVVCSAASALTGIASPIATASTGLNGFQQVFSSASAWRRPAIGKLGNFRSMPGNPPNAAHNRRSPPRS